MILPSGYPVDENILKVVLSKVPVYNCGDAHGYYLAIEIEIKRDDTNRIRAKIRISRVEKRIQYRKIVNNSSYE